MQWRVHFQGWAECQGTIAVEAPDADTAEELALEALHNGEVEFEFDDADRDSTSIALVEPA